MDRQLLRYIYRNAISNACKFGRKDGVVNTRVNYDSHLQLLTMQIINLPGVGHEKLCKLSAAEAEKIFEKNTKLKATQESETDGAAPNDDSTGNGAWIMKKVRMRCLGFTSLFIRCDDDLQLFLCISARRP